LNLFVNIELFINKQVCYFNKLKMNNISLLSLLLIFNSVFLIGSIVSQNETKDPGSIQNNSAITSPLELVTWISLSVQFVLLLFRIKFEVT